MNPFARYCEFPCDISHVDVARVDRELAAAAEASS